MEENKDLKQEEKKETAKGTAKKTVTKKATTSGTAKKTATKKTVKKETTGTTKKVASGTAKKTTTKKVAETPKIAEEKKVEIKAEPIETEKVEKIEKIEMPKKEEQPKTVEIKKEAEKPKFEPAKKVEKKKKHTILKTILMIIIVALVLFIIHSARNYIIVDNIIAKQEKLKKATNYSFETNYTNQNTTMKYYCKDNTIMIVKDSDTGKVVIWSNKDRKETIYLNLRELTATVNDEEVIDSFYNLKPVGLIRNAEESRGFDFMYFITSETVNGRDCYKVSWIFGGETAWYDKENGTMLKMTTDGQEEDYVTEYSNWKFNELTDEDMSRPNLMGYEVTTNEENNQTTNNENNQENSEENQEQENL